MANDIEPTQSWYTSVSDAGGDAGSGTGGGTPIDTSSLVPIADKAIKADVDSGIDSKWVDSALLKTLLDNLEIPVKTFTDIDFKPTDNANEYTIVLSYTDEYGVDQVLEDATPVIIETESDDEAFINLSDFETSFVCTGDVKIKAAGSLQLSTNGGPLTEYISEGIIPTGSHTLYGVAVTSTRFINDKFISIHIEKNDVMVNGERMCSGLSKLINFTVGSPNTFAKTTNLTYTWDGCINLIAFPVIDTSNVTGFYGTWRNCKSLTSFPLLNVSKGTTFNRTWRECGKLVSFPITDFPEGGSFYTCWFKCYELTNFPLIEIPKATSLDYSWAYNYKQISFPNIVIPDTVITMRCTWHTCRGLTSFPLLNTSSITNMYYTWKNCSSLVTMPVVSIENANNVRGVFEGCSSLTCIGGLTRNTTSPATVSGRTTIFKNTPSLIQPDAAAKADILAGNSWVNPTPC